MAEPCLGVVEKVTEFFATAQSEACARRTGFVRRTAKSTGKVFLALVTVGQWSPVKTAVGQLAATAAQLPNRVAGSPAAIQPRLHRRARACLPERIQRAFAKLRAEDTGGEEELFTACSRVPIADSTGFGLPDPRKDLFAGAGGSGARAGAKIPLLWEDKSHPCAPFALSPWHVPDNK